MSTFGKSRGGGRRAAARVKAPVLAVVSTITADHRAALMNISSRGVRLSAPMLPSEGEEVIFKSERVEGFGHVVWSRNGQCGIEFESPIAPTDVDRLRNAVNIFSLSGMSPEDRAAAEAWEMGVSR